MNITFLIANPQVDFISTLEPLLFGTYIGEFFRFIAVWICDLLEITEIYLGVIMTDISWGYSWIYSDIFHISSIIDLIRYFIEEDTNKYEKQQYLKSEI